MSSLFDLFDTPKEESKRDKSYSFSQDKCKHRSWQKTDTFWEDIQEMRMTWSCEHCGLIRGRG